ncbi:hypothetical protein DL546_000688 [Coniochaeta pulveracea]|uniref:Extracellular serine-rich protein n=1 Tax=Coniochaeta pulveracea TaxID=177199 RepID=A0A420Y1L2_9PEZI|nr:hypothetical protein DL546_000688 [Coniochaeta pulveracea]
MLSLSVLNVVAALLTTIYGQPTETEKGSWPEVRQETPSASDTAAPTQTVLVGAQGFLYSPNNLNATVGSTIEFRFYPGGHTVARSAFGFPCKPYEVVGLDPDGGFFSGQISPQVISKDLPAFRIRVNDTNPIFFYCTAPTSCWKNHMIGVINGNATENFDTQMQYAVNLTSAADQMAPGDPFPSEGAEPSSTGYPGGVDDDDGHHHHLSAGAIAGIAIGGAAVLVLAGALIFLCGRRGGLNIGYRQSGATAPSAPTVDSPYVQDAKSPAHTYSAQQYPNSLGGDPRTASPHTYTSSPPPGSPDQHSHGIYPNTGNYIHPGSPLMGSPPQNASGYYPTTSSPPAELQQYHYNDMAPVELPTSNDPGHSPLPSYVTPRNYSWTGGQENQYRPGHKA